MRKNKFFAILLVPLLFLLPFGNFAKAQVPSYVGIAEGGDYTWKAEANFAGVNQLLGNVRDVLVEQQENLPSLDLFGLEDLTIDEIIAQIADVYLSHILPVGWQGLNISTLIEETIEDYIETFNSTILSGMIPSNWQALNFTDFWDLVVDGLNATLPSGWEDNPLPELYTMAINELNSTLFYGLIPDGWEDFTLAELLEVIMMEYTPAIWESFVFQIMLESLMSMGLPPGFDTYTLSQLLDELVAILPPEVNTLNATALFEMMFLGLNQTMPGGMEFVNMSTVIDYITMGVNASLPMGMGWDALNMTEFLDIGIEALLNMTIPPEFHDKTILDILDESYTQLITMYDTTVLPGWAETYAMFQAMGLSSYQVGLKVVINTIGPEKSFPVGTSGVPVTMDIFYSMDFQNWINVSGMLDMASMVFMPYPIPLIGSPLMSPHIVDPSTYSDVEIALMDQVMFTAGLIVANNYDWASIQTEMTLATTGNPDCIEMSASWNANGLLFSAGIYADGIVAASISLHSVGGEIPGYEIPIILGITSLTIIAVIFYRKRKK
jgi:hypothetical protein